MFERRLKNIFSLSSARYPKELGKEDGKERRDHIFIDSGMHQLLLHTNQSYLQERRDHF